MVLGSKMGRDQIESPQCGVSTRGFKKEAQNEAVHSSRIIDTGKLEKCQDAKQSPQRKGLVHNPQGQPPSSQTQSAFHYRREERQNVRL